MTVFEKVVKFFDTPEVAVLKPSGRHLVAVKLESVPYLKYENAQGHHIIVRPRAEVEPYFLLVDDIDWPRIEKDHKVGVAWKYGRMCVETSPGNYQVWIHSSRALSLDEKRHWLKILGSDPGADPNRRWGRCPGFKNRKLKYRDENGGYPLARLVWADWRYRAQIPPVSLPEQRKCHNIAEVSRGWSHSLVGDISRAQYERGDESATDFAYAMALVRMDFSDEEIAHRIRSEREDWSNHKGERRADAYLRRTVERARERVEGTVQETSSVPHHSKAQVPQTQLRL